MYAVNYRVLYLIDQLGLGGSERQLYILLESMDRERYVPEVVVWNFREDDLYVSQMRALGVALHPLLSATSKVAKLRAFRRLVTQIKPEVVHSLTFYTNFAAWGATLGTEDCGNWLCAKQFFLGSERCRTAVRQIKCTLA